MKDQNKKRLDQLVVDLGYAETKSRAKALIMAGLVYVNGQKSDKAGTLIKTGSEILVENSKNKYVSRGGLKLEKAIKHFDIDISNKVALDIGASTGGFTDCLLQHGASKVYAFDVGHGQIDWSLRNDSRVVVKEKINCRYLEEDDVDEKVEVITVDVSFISLLKVVEPALCLLKEGGYLIALVKPQFEVGKENMEKGGIIKDIKKHEMVLKKISSNMSGLGLKVKGITESPVHGAKGNIEYLLFAVY